MLTIVALRIVSGIEEDIKGVLFILNDLKFSQEYYFCRRLGFIIGPPH